MIAKKTTNSGVKLLLGESLVVVSSAVTWSVYCTFFDSSDTNMHFSYYDSCN